MLDKTVAIVRADDYDQIRSKLHEGIKLVGGLLNLENAHIVIKPNLCSAKSSEIGATIDVNFVRGIIDIINEETRGNCRISVVESDAQGRNADYVFKFLDYSSLPEEFPNVKLVNLSKDERVTVQLNDGKVFDLLEVPRTLMDMEYMISVSKLKTHVDQRMSCIMKNQFGLITKKHKMGLHPFMSEILFDLNSLFKADLCIVDGIIGMEGFGPTDGKPKRANVILVGTDPIATDMVAARIIGFKPKQVPYLKLAIKTTAYKEDSLHIVGESIREARTKFQFIPLRHYLLARFGLRLQKWSIYLSNLGDFLQKIRSALSLVGFDAAKKRISLGHMFEIAKRMIFKLSS